MKKALVVSLFTLLLCSCGVGTYSISGGKESVGFVCVSGEKRQDVTVVVDDRTYEVQSVKTKAHKSGRDIKKTARNSIRVPSGTHSVKVFLEGRMILDKTVIVASGETKLLEL